MGNILGLGSAVEFSWGFWRLASAGWVVGIWLCGLGCGLWGPIKTNQGSGVTFGTCLLLRSLALFPESSVCICYLQNLIYPRCWIQSWHYHIYHAYISKQVFSDAASLTYGRIVKNCSRKRPKNMGEEAHKNVKIHFPKNSRSLPRWSR